MKKLLYVPLFCIAVVLLTGCFPSKRMYVIDNCMVELNKPGLCAYMPNGSEFTLVKQAGGSEYEIWVNKDPTILEGQAYVLPGCEAPVEGKKFECDFCGGQNTFKIKKTSRKRVKIVTDVTTQCPDAGHGTGGYN